MSDSPRLTRRQAVQLAGAAALPSATQAAAPELCRMTATELAARLKKKQVSAREVLKAHLDQIARVNPKVNAIVTLSPEIAEAAAKKADEAAAKGRFLGPIHGLPVAHKDLVETKGIRTTFGSPIFKDNVPTANALIVDRIQQAGAVTVGKTNTPEFGAGSQTFNPVFGATKNPWDLSKTCGGSSGGAAVALACGMVPIADGSDMGGSLRNPASFCSVVGFRVSPGRVPINTTFSPLSISGPMARNVGDLALFLSVLAGPNPASPLSIHEPGSRFAQSLDRPMKGVRIAWCPNFAQLPFDRRVREVFSGQRKTFEALGCRVEEAEPDMSNADAMFKVFRALGYVENHGEKYLRHKNLMKATVIEEVERGQKLTGPQIATAETQRAQLFARVAKFMETYEYMILPVVQVPPFDVTQEYVPEIDGKKMASYIDWMQSCYFITVTSLPALSIPGGFTTDGLPVGLQIVGRHQDDFGVLRLAHAFEQARPAIKKWPDVAA